MWIIIIIVIFIVLSSIKQIDEYERGVKFTTGKFTKIMLPGWRLVIPIFQSYKKVDIRTKAVDVPEQEAITRDNVSVKINAVIYYKVFDASKAILAVENFRYAVSQLAQTTMRNAVGAVSLDELLGEREKISEKICKIIDELTDPWGIKVENVELKDIALPEEMKRVIAKVAEAEREKPKKRKFTIVAVGRLVEAKRFDRLINVCGMLKQNHYDVDTWIIGEGHLRNELEDQIKELHLQDNVFLLGFKNPPYAYMREADLFVSTSDVEGYPLVVCEAMTLGLPIVATKITGPMELLENNRYGLLVEKKEEDIFYGKQNDLE